MPKNTKSSPYRKNTYTSKSSRKSIFFKKKRRGDNGRADLRSDRSLSSPVTVPPPGSSSRYSGRDFDKSSGKTGYGSKKKKGKAERLIAGGILAAVSAIAICLLVYLLPFSGRDLLTMARNLPGYVSECLNNLKKNESDSDQTLAAETESDSFEEPGVLEETEALLETSESVPYMDLSTEMGNISDMNAESVYPPQDDAIYSFMLDTPLGPLLYYNQGDVRWKGYLYGGADRLSKYGCGPVCTAMLINSFTPNSVSPVEIADWSAENGYYAPQSGSYHGLIPGSLTAFGLQVDSVTERTPEHATELLRSGHVLVALMGRGTLTQNGHFIIIAQSCPNGNVYIADPASYANSTKEWDLQLLMDELKKSYDSGGPLWAVSFGG